MQTAYFISDVHLSLKVKDKERERRRELFALLDQVKTEEATLVIVGDFFDFYYEWGSVVTAAYMDVYAKLKELADSGVAIHYLAGNHDFILGPALSDGIGMQVYQDAVEIEIAGKRFYCVHGDGLSMNDWKYRRFKRFIRSSFMRFCFRNLIHPNLGHWIAKQVSYGSRKISREDDAYMSNLIDENVILAEKVLNQGADYFITGHIHLPRLVKMGEKAFLTIGDFLRHFSYGYFDGVNLSLKQWPVKRLNQRVLA